MGCDKAHQLSRAAFYIPTLFATLPDELIQAKTASLHACPFRNISQDGIGVNQSYGSMQSAGLALIGVAAARCCELKTESLPLDNKAC